MQATIQYIRNELNGLYPKDEIEGFIKFIFNHLKDFSLTDMILRRNEKINPDEFKTIENIVTRLKKFEPIHYIIGMSEFRGLRIKVTPQVLIPRPETEELTEWIIREEPVPGRILDIGTGSGCIALSLKKAFPEAEVAGCDISDGALSVAIENARNNKLKVRFFKADVLDPRFLENDNDYDLIVSNPPYVTQNESSIMQLNILDHEPHSAIFVTDNEPLIFYEVIARYAIVSLNPGGRLYLEINEKFGSQVLELLQNSGFDSLALKNDLQGKNRMVKARKPVEYFNNRLNYADKKK